METAEDAYLNEYLDWIEIARLTKNEADAEKNPAWKADILERYEKYKRKADRYYLNYLVARYKYPGKVVTV